MLDRWRNVQSVLNRVVGDKETLKRQIAYTFLAVGLIPLTVASLISIMLTSNMATKLVNQNLNSLKANKLVAIEAYGKQIADQVVTSSNDPNLAINLQILSAGFDSILSEAVTSNEDSFSVNEQRKRLSNYYTQEFLKQYQASNNGETIDTRQLLSGLSESAVVLQHAYIYENPAPLGNKDSMERSSLDSTYDDAHELVHATLSDFLNRFAYYDIFLVNNNGDVIYSVYKELDFATNLYSGPYSNTGLADAFKASLSVSPQEYALIDFAQYSPSYEAPASFIASPIFRNGERMGALIFQMPLDAITTVMSERSGLGETGESYLVGQDMLLRSDSHKYPTHYTVNRSFRDNKKIETESVANAFNGESGVIESQNYMGENVLSGFIPIKFGNLKWALIAELETSEAYASVQRLQLIMLLVCVLAIAILVYTAMKMSNKILNPIESMRLGMAKVADNTDFSYRVEVQKNDEIGDSITSFNTLLDRVEVSINETNTVVSAMSNGDFSQRIKSDLRGDLLELKLGVNRSAESIQEAIQAVTSVVNAIALGDVNQSIDKNLQGDLETLKQGVNESVTAIATSLQTIQNLMGSMKKGDFKFKPPSDLPGEYGEIVKQADQATDAIDIALTEIETVMYKLASGELDARVTSDLPGQLGSIKANINSSVSAVQLIFEETQVVLQSLAEGQLYNNISKQFPGNFNALKVNVNTTISKLTQVVNEIQQAAQSVRVSTDEITNGNFELNQRTEKQATELERTAASMDEMTTAVKHTADNASHAKEIAVSARDEAQKGGAIVNEAIEAMGEINQSSEKIADIISVIDAIAFQTNLLALNAAVEAARAGEQGKGFAVVASEVRNLAGRSANAAKQIKTLIDDSVTKVKVGSQLVSDSGKTLTDIIKQVENVSLIVSDISTATEQQSAGITEVQKAVDSLQQVNQQNTAMVEHATESSHQLSEQAEGMTKQMAFFSTME
ncbi:methyl-accepting chemotaxis protein [Glaciecola sp. KUL10]|nr:methyl-accepting chemotaxis protein [Glaciecola sp. KUL10]